MRLSQKQWAALWITEGGDVSRADEASAVVMAESGGDTSIYNGVCCYGGYQFNVSVGVTTKACAVNPICATKKAISMSKNGTDWGPWEAHTNGSYQKYLGKSGFGTSNAKLASLSPNDVLQEAGEIVSPLYRLFKGGAPLPKFPGAETLEGAAKDVLGKVFNLVGLGDIAKVVEGFGELFLTREGWLRLGKLIGGAIMFIWGLRIVVRESTGTDPVRTVTKTATQVAATAATVK